MERVERTRKKDMREYTYVLTRKKEKNTNNISYAIQRSACDRDHNQITIICHSSHG